MYKSCISNKPPWLTWAILLANSWAMLLVVAYFCHDSMQEWFGYKDHRERVWVVTSSEASRVSLSANPPTLCKPQGALTARQPIPSVTHRVHCLCHDRLSSTTTWGCSCVVSTEAKIESTAISEIVRTQRVYEMVTTATTINLMRLRYCWIFRG